MCREEEYFDENSVTHHCKLFLCITVFVIHRYAVGGSIASDWRKQRRSTSGNTMCSSVGGSMMHFTLWTCCVDFWINMQFET